MEIDENRAVHTIQARFVSDTGEEKSSALNLPVEVLTSQLALILNAVLENEEATNYIFYVNDVELKDSLSKSIDFAKIDTENILDIVYQPQAVFKVRPVTRCTSSMPGHAEAVVSISFSPDCQHMASGSGDTTMRLWDLNTETPHFSCQGHRQWVLSIAWSPDSSKIASACKLGEIRIWNPETGGLIGKPLTGHKSWVNCLSWEPYHMDPENRRLASASNDSSVRIWDTVTSSCQMVLGGHSASVTAVRWGGNGLIYTSSRDRTIKVWRATDGALCRTLTGHAHWINNLALSCDYVLRTGPFNPVLDRNSKAQKSKDELKLIAYDRYKKVCPDEVEGLVSCSDDFTLFLWKSDQNKCITRMTGHQNVVNDVKYSPDTKYIASASFDKSIRLWRSHDGAFITTFRGHVQAVYQIAWSADSRIFVSSSKDSTLKVWSVLTKKLVSDLPGHADEVFAVDWAPDGSRVASGGKDKVVKMWTY